MVGGGGRTAVMVVLLPRGAAGTVFRLDEEEAHHLRVRRAEAGEVVGVRDGAGLVGSGTLSRDGRGWVVELAQVESVARPALTVLAVGAGDRERFGWMIEKATELGVGMVVPIETARTAGVGTKVRAGHLEKLRRHAIDVLKQSGGAWATVIEEPVALERFLATARSGERWLADQRGPPAAARLGAEPVTVLVGPEGGFTDAEREAIVEAGYRPTMLGTLTLRFETAAVAAVAAVNLARLRGVDG